MFRDSLFNMISTVVRVWKTLSVGLTQISFDPKKTMAWNNGKMRQSEKTLLQDLEGDQKIGGGTTWGWYSYDPKNNMMYYGSGNPSTWSLSSVLVTTSGL